MADVTMSLEEYLALINGAQLMDGLMTAAPVEQEKPKPRRKSKYATFSKKFQFRKKKRTESSTDYLAARAKAVARAWRREKKK